MDYYKKCIKCDFLLMISKENFRYHKGNFSNICLKCTYKKEKERRLNNKDFALKRKQYYESNKKEYIKKCKEYRLRNLEEIRRKDRLRKGGTPRINIPKGYTVFSLQRIALTTYIKNNCKTCKYLSYTIDELKKHLESQFEPWMNWNNLGKYSARKWDDNDSSTWTWQIDHIIPLSNFHYTSCENEDFKKCWSLSNLRPLCSKKNVIEGAIRKRHTTPKKTRIIVKTEPEIKFSQDIIDLVKLKIKDGIGSRTISKELGISRYMVQKVVSYLNINVSNKKNSIKSTPKHKICTKCKIDKDISNFRERIDRRNKSNYSIDRSYFESMCLLCEKEYNKHQCKEYYAKKKKHFC